MPRMIDVVVIEPGDNHGTHHRIDGDSLETYQRLVGGWIEYVPCRFRDMGMYIDEEGKYKGEDGGPKPRNELATRLAMPLGPGDYIAGTAVIIGLADDEGNTLGVPSHYLVELTS